MTYRLEDLPKDELQALYEVAQAGGEAIKNPLYRYAQIRARKLRKARLNARSDSQRRVLVGARLPREEAWIVQNAAARKGLSLYAFCREALLKEAKSTISTSFVDTVERSGW